MNQVLISEILETLDGSHADGDTLAITAGTQAPKQAQLHVISDLIESSLELSWTLLEFRIFMDFLA